MIIISGKSRIVFFLLFLVSLAMFFSFPRFSLGAGFPGIKPLVLNNVSVSKFKGGSLVWFKFNRNASGVVPVYKFNGYSLELNFNGTGYTGGPKFIKYGNDLISGVEVIPDGNGALNIGIYFDKGIRVKQNDIREAVSGDYFIIKIYHNFSGGLFSKIGKNNPLQSLSAIKSIKPDKAKAFNANGILRGSSGNKDVLGKKNRNASSGKKIFSGGSGFNPGFEAAKTIFYLALILAFIYGIYFFINKFKGKFSTQNKNLDNLKILSSLNLGNKKSILFIEAGGERFIVGVSNSSIQVIGKVDGNKRDEIGIKAEKEGTGFMGSFISDAVEHPGQDDLKWNFQDEDKDESTQAAKGFDGMLKSKVNSSRNEKTGVSKTAELAEEEFIDLGKADSTGNMKIKKISEARGKGRAENVFFDIEERLKGLIENESGNRRSTNSGNIKKF